MKLLLSLFTILFYISSTYANTVKIEFTQEEQDYIKNKKTIIIANEFDWVPFDFNEDGEPKGYIIDYIKLLSQKVGLEPVFVTDKWSNLITRLQKNEIDILPVVSYNKKRESFLSYTDSYMNQDLSIVLKQSRNDIINLDDLKNKKIGMIKNWNITNILKNDYQDLNIIEFDSIHDIFDAIQNNFIEASIVNSIFANYIINRHYHGVLKSNIPIKLKGFDEKLYIGVRKDLEILTKIFNKAISQISENELSLLENKWIKPIDSIDFSQKEKEFIKNTTIHAITGSSWAPFTFIDNDNLHGISIDFWNYIKEKAKLKTTIEAEQNFFHALDAIKEKQKDITLSTSKTKDREKYGIFSNQYMSGAIGVATLEDKHYIDNAKELLNKKIAVGKNFSAHRLLEEQYPDMDFVLVNTVKDGLDLVSKNKVYAYADIIPVLSYSIERYGFTNIKVSGQTEVDFKLSFMIRSDYPLLKSIIDKIIRNMSYEDKQKILNKWIKAKFEKQFDYSLLWKIVLVFLVILFFILFKNRQLKKYQTKLEKAQKETQNSLDNFKTLINLNIAGVLIIKNQKIIYTNDEILRILEFKAKYELIDKNIDNILLEDIDKVNSLIKDSNESYESKAQKSNKEEIPILIRSNSISFKNIDCIILSIIDISDIKNKDMLMMQQSKMAGLGEMLGNIAHQWRQPLSFISTSASGLKIQKEYGKLDDEQFDELLDGITDTTMFLSHTIDNFRDYIQGDKAKKEFNIKNTIEKILTLMDGSLSNHFIQVQTHIEDAVIIGYEGELDQVLLNILTNSKDALKEVDENNRKIFINCFKESEHIIIQIIDSGGGIEQSNIEKVFEPYFTTKHKSQGTGLGLYMTHNIVKQNMQGDIKIKNIKYDKFPKCAKVSILLPLEIEE